MAGFREIFKATSVYTILGFLPTASRIIVLPVFLKFLDITDFAYIGLNSLIASILPLIMTLGLEHAYARLYFDYRSKPKLLKAFTSTTLLMITGQAILFSLVLIPIGDPLFRSLFESERFTFNAFGISAVIMAVFFSINSLINAHFRSKKSVGAFALFSVGQFLLSLTAECLAIIVYRANAETVIWVRLIANGSITLIFLIYMLWKNGILFEARFLRPSLRYALPLIPYTTFGLIFTNADRVMIENLDIVALGAFNLAMAIASISDSFMFAVQSATYPSIYELFKQNIVTNAARIDQLYRLIGILVIIVICLLIAATPVGIYCFLDKAYFVAVPIVPIILGGYVFRYLYIVYAEPLFYFKRTRRLPWLNILSGSVSLLSNLILIPLAGLFGAAVASVLAKFSQFSLTFHWYKKDDRVHFNLQYLVPLISVVFILCCLIPLSITYSFPPVVVYTAYFVPLIFIITSVCLVMRTRLAKNKDVFSFRKLLDAI